MNKHKGLVLAITLSTVGFSSAYAEQSMLSQPQSGMDKSIIEEDEATGVLSIDTDDNDLIESEFFISDTSSNSKSYLNLTYPSKYLQDTVNLRGVLNYLEQVKPVVNDNGMQDIEMIEIL